MRIDQFSPKHTADSFPPHQSYPGLLPDWPQSSETPPPPADRLAPFGHTFYNATESSIQATEDLDTSSTSHQPVFPPSSVPHAPSPPYRTTEGTSEDSSSVEELYGPDRLFGPPSVARGTVLPSIQPAASLAQVPRICEGSREIGSAAVGAIFSNGVTSLAMADPTIPSMALTNPGQYFKDAIARDASNVTPGVDDTPYILYALDALTGNINTSSGVPGEGSTAGNHNSFPFRHIPDDGLGYYRPRSFSGNTANIGTSAIKMPTPPSSMHHGADRRYSMRRNSGYESRGSQQATPRVSESANPAEPRTSTTSTLSTLVHSHVQAAPRSSIPANHLKDAWSYLDLKTFSPQAQLVFPLPTFKPVVMRPLSLLLVVFLCMLMLAALIFTAVFSRDHHGLVEYSGSIYSGQFFLFRVLPQVLAAAVVLYAQSLSTAIIRISPFARMQALGHPHPEERNGAIFDNIYPGSFLFPQISRAMPWRIRIPVVIFWLANFIVPVQSCLFSVIKYSGTWRWAAVQGVIWTLVAFYLVLAATFIFVLIDWYARPTGLIWDPRSIADIITLATNSNTMADYNGTELLGNRGDMRSALQHRTIDKLGYWTWRDGRTSGLWHGIGTDALDDAWFSRQNSGLEAGNDTETTKKIRRSWNEKNKATRSTMPDNIDLEALALSPHSENVRYRYLPWSFRDGPLILFIFVSFVLLLVLFIVSFLPATNIKHGFLPMLDAQSSPEGFSRANFLYSFLPALLGQVLYLLFSSLDMTLRILQPWAELCKNAGGAQPATSILADYAACLPLQVTWHALVNRHWRVAAVSLTATCSAFMPALAGGLFMALTVSTGEVLMVPNMALYAVFLTFLVVLFACLVSVLPGRKNSRLPHGVTCIAEILSFCASEDLLQEPAFKNAHNRTALLNQLGINSLPVARSRWIFATGTSGDDRRLSIRRVRRYTELTNRPSGRRPPQMSG